MTLRVTTASGAAIAAVSAAELAAVAAQAAAGGLVGNVHYAAPNVTGTSGAGTLASPWALPYALTQLQPGDALIALGGTYKPYSTHGLARDIGFNFTSVGTMLKPCTFMAMPGQTVLIEDPYDTSMGWTRVMTDEGGALLDTSINVWESNFTVRSSDQVLSSSHFVTGHYFQDGDWHVIGAMRGPVGPGPNFTTSTNILSMYRISSRFRFDGKYYPSPMLIRLGNGKIRIRLDPPQDEKHEWGQGNPFFGEITQVYPHSNNPNFLDLKIYRQDDVLFTMSGAYTHVSGIHINGGARAAIRVGASGCVLRNSVIRSAYVGISVGRTDAAVIGGVDIHDNIVDGMLDRLKTPIWRGDIKSGDPVIGGELLVNSRSQAIVINESARNGRVYGNLFDRFFDGTVFSSRDWEFGFTPPDEWPLTEIGRQEIMLAKGNVFRGAFDDAMQLYSRAIGLNVHHNRIYGAGIGRDGATSSIDWGPRKVSLHHNIFDGARYSIGLERCGRDFAVLSQNKVVRTIATAIVTTTTEIMLNFGTALPALSGSRRMTLVKASDHWQRETVLVTAIGTANSVTVTRGQAPNGNSGNDTPLDFAVGDLLVDNFRDTRFTEEGRCCPNIVPIHGEPFRVPSDTVSPAEWSAVIEDLSGGVGPSQVKVEPVYLYVRMDPTLSVLVPPLPTTIAIYTFADGMLADHNNGWTQAVPAANGLSLWEIQSVAAADDTATTASIAPTKWRTPRRIAGPEGSGRQGGGVLLRLYRRNPSAPTTAPAARTYTYGVGDPPGPNILSQPETSDGWLQSVPAGTDRLWVVGVVVNRSPRYRFPWNFYHNTCINSETLSGQPGGYIAVFQYGNEADDILFGNPSNIVMNNLFLIGGQRSANTTNPPYGISYLAASRIYTVRGDNIHDGNAVIRQSNYALLLAQQVRTSGTLASPPIDYSNVITTLKGEDPLPPPLSNKPGFRSPKLPSDAATYAGLPDGFESKGVDGQATISSQIDSNYRPVAAELKTDAFELTRFGLPGMQFYQSWRGALPPLELLP